MGRARQSISQLMDIAPNIARILRLNGEVDVPVEEIQVDDIMIIRPGEKIAMDGRIIKGESAFLLHGRGIRSKNIPLIPYV